MGMSPLHWAAARGHKDVVELLVANKIDINAKDNDGETPLNLAGKQGQLEVVQWLREHGGHI